MEAPTMEAWPKRKRVLRACDRCRAKKAKCDGGQPCGPCSIYEHKCTFQRMRCHRGPLYVEELEVRVRRLEALLTILCPDVDLDTSNLESTVLLQCHADTKNASPPTMPTRGLPGTADHKAQPAEADHDKLLDTIIEVAGRLELDEQGNYEYYERFAGFTFLRRAQEQCKQLLGVQLQKDFCLSSPSVPETFKATGSCEMQRLAAILESVEILPARRVAQKLVCSALADACCLIRFVHRPTFDQSFNRIYEIQPRNYEDQDLKFLPQLYIIMAVGVLASKDGAGNLARIRMEGSKYFRAGQRLVNVIECRDLVSLQAIIAMIFYLQSVGEISTCYSYISVALASSLRMGLHRSDAVSAFDLIERETRKRIFWILRSMETYVTTLLGLPKLVDEEDIDQEQPLEADDECITTSTISPTPRSHTPVISATIAHIQLTTILANVVRFVYRSKDGCNEPDGLCQVDYTKVVTVEKELEQWCQRWPPALTHISTPTMRRDLLLLQIAYGHVQMILYRPFLRSALGCSTNDSGSKRSSACAIACVKAARQVVLLLEQLQERGFLNGSYWFTVYTLYSAVVWLLVYILGRDGDPDMPGFVKAARSAHQILCSLAPRSALAERCAISLSPLFEQLAILYQNPSGERGKQPDLSNVNGLEGLMDDYLRFDMLAPNLELSLDPAPPQSLEIDADRTTVPDPNSYGANIVAEPPAMWEPERFIPETLAVPQHTSSFEYDKSINPLLLTGNPFVT